MNELFMTTDVGFEIDSLGKYKSVELLWVRGNSTIQHINKNCYLYFKIMGNLL